MKSRKHKGTLPNREEEPENFLLHHICEICGKHEWLTSQQGYAEGWDYPPKMGVFGVLSPRTCGDCGGIEGTVWYALAVEGKTLSDLTDSQRETVWRITHEPNSIMSSIDDN